MSRSRTIGISLFVALLSSGFGLASAQVGGNARQAAQQGGDSRQQAQGAKPAANPTQTPQITMQQLLALWEGQSAKLQTLELDMYRVDTDPTWGDEEHYLGHAAFKSPQLAFLDFRKVKMQEKPDPKDKRKKVFVPVKIGDKLQSVSYETIVCTGEEVWQYRYDERKIYTFPLDKEERKRALEEGPLPFLFNMRAAEANRRYNMKLQAEDETRYLVRIEPLLKEDQATFSTAWVYLDKEYLLPKRIFLLGPDGRSSKNFALSHIKANEPVDPVKFQGVNPKNWFKIVRNPGGPDPAAKPRALRKQQQGQSAQRPAATDAAQPR
jgi:TIGR03009 family protein